MSILLEALRKSEKRQRPHETPTIHTDVQSGSSSDSRRYFPLALMLIAALALTGWFVWNQYRDSAGNYQPPVTLSAGQVHKTPAAAVAGQGAADTTVKTPLPPGAAQNRTPVESYQPPVESTPAPAVAEAPSAPATGAGTAIPGGKLSQGAAGTSPTGRMRTGAVAPAGKPPATATATVAEQPATGETGASKTESEFHPGEPEPIGYWELPDAIRADVPEIKFSVLVYAANPADRFVLINGQRLGEGESVKPGLVIKEIRREGVVFSYRLYQFLVER